MGDTRKLSRLQQTWDRLGEKNPFWAALTSSDEWDQETFFETGRKEVSDLMDYIHTLPVTLGSGRALDFGCGAGRLSQALSAYFDEVHGVDIAPSMIQVAEQFNRHNEKCRYHLNPDNDLRLFPDDHFDFIYSNLVLQHIAPDYTFKYLKEFLRILAPSGLLIFQLPSRLISNNRLLQALFDILPASFWLGMAALRDAYRQKPAMEMHGIERDKVIAFLPGNGGEVLDVQLDKRPTTEHSIWEHYMYTVTKG
ncbi:MAG TPA: class I SAM-dependent methyltransferase [Anaerolineales bacterium]|nr:class I SAM-dependent methyltransferase [Anaerolineales bacterium]